MFKNWKTTAIAGFMFITQFGGAVGLSPKTVQTITALGAVAGFSLTKDHDVTGDGK